MFKDYFRYFWWISLLVGMTLAYLI
jgi:hypothetical protein